jgi:hypothetical protein
MISIYIRNDAFFFSIFFRLSTLGSIITKQGFGAIFGVTTRIVLLNKHFRIIITVFNAQFYPEGLKAYTTLQEYIQTTETFWGEVLGTTLSCLPEVKLS